MSVRIILVQQKRKFFMKTSLLAKIGSGFFIAWGALHILGGGMILAGLVESPASGFAAYQQSDAEFPALAGAILGYFSYLLICLSIAVIAIGVKFNWRNDKFGLALNTGIVVLVEIGLIVFLLLPGFVSVAEAGIGLALAVLAVVISGIACSREHN